MWTRVGLFVAVASLAATAAAAQPAPKPPANDDCVACHGDAAATRDDGRSIAVDAALFAASTHGPMACVDCHADLSKVAEYPHPAKLAKVDCGSCHDNVKSKYRDSIHARAREKAGLIVAPACADCHTAHAIQRADTETWKLSVAAECGTCHARVVDSFRRTFHGKVTELGFTRVATCADCHGAHDILPAANGASKIARAHLVETCGRCHAGANEQFVKYDPHPNPSDYSRSRVLWWANIFYWVLIPGCFGFFGLHSALWYWRSRKDSR